MNLISIIIPYFKKREFIKKTMNSIIKQTYKNIEIIIIYDDENQDDLNYIMKLKDIDKRIRVIINKKSLGAGQSRNKGISAAKGKFIAFIDADDKWKKNKLKLQIDFMLENKFKISHTSYDIVNKKNQFIKTMKAKDFDHYKELLPSCDIGLSTVILEKKIIGSTCQFSNLKTKEDFVLWLLILKKGFKIGALERNLTLWMKLDNSLSAPVLQKIIDGFRVYYVHMKFNLFKSLYFLLVLCLKYLKK
tara:strand:- start:503 stop:1243 length:741 start_codon:yes stop_codon:yes gene_type:complete